MCVYVLELELNQRDWYIFTLSVLVYVKNKKQNTESWSQQNGKQHREHFSNFTYFVAHLEFFGQIHTSHILSCFDYARRLLLRGMITLIKCHICITTVPCQSTLPTMPGPWKCTVLEHSTESLHRAIKPDYLKSCLA